jgi:peptidoglycan/xylan/chitin deacetylase (PgdA/CDA1 family)
MTPPRDTPDVSDTCLVVSYHYVRDVHSSAFPRLKALHPDAFADQIRTIERERDIVDYDAFHDAVEAGRSLDRSAMLTFDDGLLDHYQTVFPTLKAHGHHGIFFVSPETNLATSRVLNVQKVQLLLARLGDQLWDEIEGALSVVGGGLRSQQPNAILYRYDSAAIRRVKQLLNYDLPLDVTDMLLSQLFAAHIGDEREVAAQLYLTPSMIREMSAAGMTFGYHTRDHRVLSRLPVDEQRAQLEGGVEWIRSLTNQATVPFCYPHGHAHAYTRETVMLLRQLGYSMAFTAVRGASRPQADDRFEFPRFDTRDVPTAAAGVAASAAPSWSVST